MGKMGNFSHIDAIFLDFCLISYQFHTSFAKICTCSSTYSSILNVLFCRVALGSAIETKGQVSFVCALFQRVLLIIRAHPLPH